ncbi:DinB family protein [Kocuria sp. SM24M-10]|uniref:DinB family protein n=1 Tax=Kocuria sp. SM24M-10 TaxID=1660349 RepID=UPI000649B5AE|nr:DinB family protein [Kocuria sp. SM24M-10]KLU11170.1 methyltransferase type 12 [Kocuria sp. SM24M-10]
MTAERPEAPDISPVPPETKDWTVVIDQGCGECGFDPHLDVSATGELVRDTVERWVAVLERPRITERPRPGTWSPLEYACHVRDLCRVFRERLRLMLDEEHPVLPDWDQDAVAVQERYNEQDPYEASGEIAQELRATADAFDAVAGEQWARTGRRGDGTEFTVARLAVYFRHDVEHHLRADVRG